MIRVQSSASSLPHVPNIIVPRQCVLTRTPVVPSVRYSMLPPFYVEPVLSMAAKSLTTEPRSPCSSASARNAASSRVPAQTSTGHVTSIGTSLRMAAR